MEGAHGATGIGASLGGKANKAPSRGNQSLALWARIFTLMHEKPILQHSSVHRELLKDL
jgi:hypothetical protein